MASQHHNTATHSSNGSEGSKFKRFLKKFGRKPSDEGVTGINTDHHDPSAATSPTISSPMTANSNTNGRASAKSTSKSRGKNVFSNTANQPTSNRPGETRPSRTNSTAAAVPPQGASNFPLPSEGTSQAPQLNLPGVVDSRDTQGLASVIANQSQGKTVETADGLTESGGEHVGGLVGSASHPEATASAIDQEDVIRSLPTSSSLAVEEQVGGVGDVGTNDGLSVLGPLSTYGRTAHFSDHSSTSPSHSRADTSFEDVDSTEGIRRRDSSDSRTVDTGKSTKPTTLMSLDTRENAGSAGLAHIAQYRHGEASSPTFQSSPAARAATSSPTIQFATSPSTGSRLTSGGAAPLVNLPGYGEPSEGSPYTNVPAISRPHPSNNPTPSGIPPDNASVLTLASSTAAQSIGGAPSVRQGVTQAYHYAPSLGGARSIGGSLMGDRRNSSDTYASVRALPPLSRRGSDESTRTGRDSVLLAPSAAGLTSANSMMTGTGGNNASSTNISTPQTSTTSTTSTTGISGTGLGAPIDRVGVKRTDSQRTVATQLSIPLSVSASNHAALLASSAASTAAAANAANAAAERRASSSGSTHLLGSVTTGGGGGGGGSSSTTGQQNFTSSGTPAPPLSLVGSAGHGENSSSNDHGEGVVDQPPSSSTTSSIQRQNGHDPSVNVVNGDTPINSTTRLTSPPETQTQITPFVMRTLGHPTSSSSYSGGGGKPELNHIDSSGAQKLRLQEEGKAEDAQGDVGGVEMHEVTPIAPSEGGVEAGGR